MGIWDQKYKTDQSLGGVRRFGNRLATIRVKIAGRASFNHDTSKPWSDTLSLPGNRKMSVVEDAGHQSRHAGDAPASKLEDEKLTVSGDGIELKRRLDHCRPREKCCFRCSSRYRISGYMRSASLTTTREFKVEEREEAAETEKPS